MADYYQYILVEDWPKFEKNGWKIVGRGPVVGGWVSLTVMKKGEKSKQTGGKSFEHVPNDK